MTKRKGVNSRKHYAQKRQLRVKSIRKGIPLFGGMLLVVVITAGIIYSGKISYDKIVAWVRESSLFTIKNISVKGNDRIPEKAILSECGVAVSTKIYDVNVAAVGARLLQHPWIEKVHCVKKWWGSVAIEITERVPVALCAAGEVALVARDGTVLPLEKMKQYDLPLLTGLRIKSDRHGKRHVDSSRIDKVVRFIDALQHADQAFFTSITQMDVSDTSVVRGFAVRPKTVVEIGYDADKVQIRNCRILLDALAERNETPDCISVVYRNIAFVRNETTENEIHAD